jgi:hypothetical protein
VVNTQFAFIVLECEESLLAKKAGVTMKWADVVKATQRQTKVIVLEYNPTIPDIPS